MYKSKKTGFSLVEAMIVVVVLAIGIVAMTPTITKKITNKLEFGTSLTGNTHGRYEVYMKEIYSLNDLGLYEKMIDETKNDGIVLYERKTNPELFMLTKGYQTKHSVISETDPHAIIGYEELENPTAEELGFGLFNFSYILDSTSIYKAPDFPDFAKLGCDVYEEFRDVIPHRDSSGKITHVTFTRTDVTDPDGTIIWEAPGIPETVAVGGRYSIENQNVVYRRGSFQKRDGQDVWVLDKDLKEGETNPCATDWTDGGVSFCTDPLSLDWRVIQGKFTQQVNYLANYKNSPDRNNFFVAYGNDNSLIGHADDVNNRGKVTYVPWERMYDGNKLVLDRQIPLTDGRAIAFFNPTNIVKNATIHAVGGGGAGGGIYNYGKATFLKDLSDGSAELNYVVKDLANRFRTITGRNWSDNEIIKIKNEEGLYKKQYTDIFGPESDNTYIVLNLYDGSINVKVDRRQNGIRVMPEQLLQYTNVLGTGLQAPEKWNMVRLMGNDNPLPSVNANNPPDHSHPWGTTPCVKNGTCNFNYIVTISKKADGTMEQPVCTKPITGGNMPCPERDDMIAHGVDVNGTGLTAGSSKTYHHIFTWSVPYAYNSLKYGTSGEPGVYVHKIIPLINNRIAIELGKGGEWQNFESAVRITSGKVKPQSAPDGGDTTIKTCTPDESNEFNCDAANINEFDEKYTDLLVSAPGGKGGKSDLSTYKYDLCWTYQTTGDCYAPGANPNDPNAKKLEACCGYTGAYGISSQIQATYVKTSDFENNRAVTGMSKVVGLGAGRGAQGLNSISGAGVMPGDRLYINSSTITSDNNPDSRTIIHRSLNPKDKRFNNYPEFPAPTFFQGGNGAVIITW